MDDADSATATFDMDSAVDQVTEALGMQEKTAPEPETVPVESAASPATEPTTPPAETTPLATNGAPPEPTPMPPSFRADLKDLWAQIPPKAQDYYLKREQDMLKGLEQYKHDAGFAKSFREALTPYAPTLQKLRLDPITAAQHLFQADHILRYAPMDQRVTYFKNLATQYGIDLNTAGGPQPTAATVDPVVQSLQQKIEQISQNLTAREQADLQAAQERTGKEVEAFASDPAHAYFDEVADDLVRLIHTGLPLQEAYEKAVWANPMTRQKELTRIQTEDAAKAKENARLAALPKQKAKSVNVRSLDTKRAPTEPLGSMEDIIRESLAERKARS